MSNRIIEGMTVEDAITKYERMVYKMVHAAKMNVVCSFEDLVQEGNLAIVNAFEKFDENKGVSFTTWVYTYIRGAILDYQKRCLSILSGTGYFQSVLHKEGQDVTPEKLIELGYSPELAKAVGYMANTYSSVHYDGLIDLVADEDYFDKVEIKQLPWRKYLTKREIEVIELAYGFNGEPLTAAEISKKLGITSAYVTEVKRIAYKKLRKAYELKDFL